MTPLFRQSDEKDPFDLEETKTSQIGNHFEVPSTLTVLSQPSHPQTTLGCRGILFLVSHKVDYFSHDK